ncbi:MAG: hypothetical protein HQM14_20810 [SAR324 cluster bacterium]|nr:hypothetical protein [SAR324 cluster bacterium]
MAAVLTQEEVDALLRGNPDDWFDDRPDNGFADIGVFEEFITNRKWEPEEPYGLFTKDVSVIKFRKDNKSESLLADIKSRNEASGMGNVTIPGTSIELINYSYCPKCSQVYSFEDLSTYYQNPVQDPKIPNRMNQMRSDSRVCCFECRTFFIPALIISDGTPKQDVQFLCRLQIVESIEDFYSHNLQRKVLTTNKKNHLKDKYGRRAVLNDVRIRDLTPKPTLIANFIQYTPPGMMLSFVEGKNIKNKDVLYGVWQ